MAKKVNTPRHSDALTSGKAEKFPTYEVGGITFLVAPVYKEGGESVTEILRKLMKNDAESVS